jgi:hypothetical protein
VSDHKGGAVAVEAGQLEGAHEALPEGMERRLRPGDAARAVCWAG